MQIGMLLSMVIAAAANKTSASNGINLGSREPWGNLSVKRQRLRRERSPMLA